MSATSLPTYQDQRGVVATNAHDIIGHRVRVQTLSKHVCFPNFEAWKHDQMPNVVWERYLVQNVPDVPSGAFVVLDFYGGYHWGDLADGEEMARGHTGRVVTAIARVTGRLHEDHCRSVESLDRTAARGSSDRHDSRKDLSDGPEKSW